MFNIYEDGLGYKTIIPEDKKLIFNKTQFFWILCFFIFSIFSSSLYGWEDKNCKILIDNLFTMSVSIFGFTLTSYAVLISLSNTSLIERLKTKTSLYYSLITNMGWLLYILFFDIIVSFIVDVFYDTIKVLFSELILSTILIGLISLTFSLLWYSSSRLIRILKEV